jgi:hypothetical protein
MVMGHRSPAKLIRSVKRMTKFLERKRPVLEKFAFLELILHQFTPNYRSSMFKVQISLPLPTLILNQFLANLSMPLLNLGKYKTSLRRLKARLRKSSSLKWLMILRRIYSNRHRNLDLPSTSPGFPLLHIQGVFTLDPQIISRLVKHKCLILVI